MAANRGRYFDGSKGSLGGENLFIVEGPDDAYFLETLLKQINAPEQKVGIIYLEGKTKLQDQISNLLKSREFQTGAIKRYSIIRDADAKAQDALAEVHSALSANSQPLPAHGALVSDGRVEVGIFIIPSGERPGDLESLCIATVDSDQRVIWGNELIGKVEGKFGRLPKPTKSLAAIYLACRPEETRGVGRAFNMGGIFDDNHASLDELKKFVKTAST